MTAPLENLNILDFSTLLPGPCATMMLADMGANVLRVESPTRPDLLRHLSPMQGEKSASHNYLNRSKRSLGLDLKKEGAIGLVKELVKKYDVVIEQFRPGVMDRLGIGYEQLCKINPRLIYCSITGFGQTGPYCSKPGHDINYVALAGISSHCGRKETGPAPLGIQIADVAGGSHHAVMGVLAAVVKRLQTGEGEYIDISMSDAALSFNHMAMAGYLATGQNPDLESSMLSGATCYDYYATADDRYLSVGALEPQFVQSLCALMGIEEIVPLMLSQHEGNQRRAKLALTKLFKQKALSHWLDLFEGAEVCVEPVLNFDEVVNHPHFKSREAFCEVPAGDGGGQKQLASPIKFSSYQNSPEFIGVKVGEHNSEVLEELGISEEGQERLKAQGVFGT